MPDGFMPSARSVLPDGAPGKPLLRISWMYGEFGHEGDGSQGLIGNLVVTNGGTATAQSLVVGVTGADFTQTGTSCAASLDPGASCGVDVKFAPQIAGPRTGSLNVAAAGGA